MKKTMEEKAKEGDKIIKGVESKEVKKEKTQMDLKNQLEPTETKIEYKCGIISGDVNYII